MLRLMSTSILSFVVSVVNRGAPQQRIPTLQLTDEQGSEDVSGAVFDGGRLTRLSE